MWPGSNDGYRTTIGEFHDISEIRIYLSDSQNLFFL